MEINVSEADRRHETFGIHRRQGEGEAPGHDAHCPLSLLFDISCADYGKCNCCEYALTMRMQNTGSEKYFCFCWIKVPTARLGQLQDQNQKSAVPSLIVEISRY